MVMYDNEFKTKGNKIQTKNKMNHNIYIRWPTQLA